MNQTQNTNSFKVLLIGPGHIGSVFANIASHNGDTIAGVVASSHESAKQHAQSLQKHPQHAKATPFPSIETALQIGQFDGAIISSSESSHLQALQHLLKTNIPILCEKPLIAPFDKGDKKNSDTSLTEWAALSERPFVFNASNHHLMNVIKWQDTQEDFYFRFHTNGPHQGTSILSDLLPHCISFLQVLWGLKCAVRFPDILVEKHHVAGQFHYGSQMVHFDFEEGPQVTKDLSFGFSNAFYTRVQEGFQDSYKVFIKGPYQDMNLKTGSGVQKYICQDPFAISYDRFRKTMEDADSSAFDLPKAIANFKVCQKILTECAIKRPDYASN